MSTQPSNCPGCGAVLVQDAGGSVTECPYCQRVLARRVAWGQPARVLSVAGVLVALGISGWLFMQNTAPAATESSPAIDGFDVTRNAAISGHNNLHLSNVSPEDCARACRDEKNFVCRSFDYYKHEDACDLSTQSAASTSLKTDYPGNPYDHYARR